MNQDKIFGETEGNNWFNRNKAAIGQSDKVDWPCHLIELLDSKSSLNSVIELGCSNGYRLSKIKNNLKQGCRFVGVDASQEAIQDGRSRYPDLDLFQGLLSDIPLLEEFELVIVNFVLHWVDRNTLAKSIAEIDRVTKDQGFLILGDFLPDCQQRRSYHHLPGEGVYTYKQDYVKIFEALGTYRELARVTFNHDNPSYAIWPAGSSERGFCSVLYKSLDQFYTET